jgi:hypothetical protein
MAQNQWAVEKETKNERVTTSALTSAARSSVPSVSNPSSAWQRGGVGGKPRGTDDRAFGFGAKPTGSFEAPIAVDGRDDAAPGRDGGRSGDGAWPKPHKQTRPSPALAVKRAWGLAKSCSAETGPGACAVQLST